MEPYAFTVKKWLTARKTMWSTCHGKTQQDAWLASTSTAGIGFRRSH
jgi:hypothetical protein